MLQKWDYIHTHYSKWEHKRNGSREKILLNYFSERNRYFGFKSKKSEPIKNEVHFSNLIHFYVMYKYLSAVTYVLDRES